MSVPSTPEGQGPSTRPYLIRALHDWCTDNGFTPYLAVFVDDSVHVPSEYVKNREIVLNVSFEATSGLRLGNEFIEFKARFGGVARDIVVPVDRVAAIYARENGQGMAFPLPGEPLGSRIAPVGDRSGPAASGGAETPQPNVIRLGAAAEAVPAPPAAVNPGAAASAPPAAPRPGRAEDPPRKPPGRPSLKRIK